MNLSACKSMRKGLRVNNDAIGRKQKKKKIS